MMTLYIRSNQAESMRAREAVTRAGVNCLVRDVLRSHRDMIPTPTLVDGNTECVGLASIVGHIRHIGALDKARTVCYSGA